MAEKKYTPRSLKKAVERYFASITRIVPLTEPYDTGEKDKMGHAIYAQRPVTNTLGEQVEITEYLVPPSVGGLCEHLGIHRATWANYCDREKNPEMFDTTTQAQGRMRAWNEQQLLTRSGKDIKGIIFNLENNYGYREKQSVEITGGVEDYLRKLAESGGGQEF